MGFLKGLWTSVKSPVSAPMRRARRLYVTIASLVALIAGTLTIYSIVKQPPPAPYVFVAATAPDSNTQPGLFLAGFDGRFQLLRPSTQVHSQDETLDNTAALANECLGDPACHVFIGNSTSTFTETTLDVFLNHDPRDRPVFILPFATATNLTKKATSMGYGGILRVVPDNDNQADVIARLLYHLEDRKADSDVPRIIIYIDEDNRTYSESLARAVATRVRAQGGGYVLAEENIGPSNSALPTLQMWRQVGKERAGSLLDAVVYVGTAHHCLLLIDQMVQMGSDVPVVFTDGCSIPNFDEKARELKGEAYMLSAAESYRTIGQTTAYLVNHILARCPDCDDRTALSSYVAKNKTRLRPNDEVRDLGTEYRFNQCGNNEAIDFAVLRVASDGLEPFPLPTNGGEVDETATAFCGRSASE